MANKGKSNSLHIGSMSPDELWQKSPDIIRRFIEQRPDYEQLCTEIGYIVNKRLGAKKVEVSTITWRAKTLNSFLDKLERKKYGDPFQEITDFAGVRVVCLYLADIPLIEEIINSEFEVIEKVDKLNDKGADRFGYGALHFIVKLGEGASGARYDDLKDLVCEIQVRTVLQDAWAIIDHHLVYKNESNVPTPLQRKLNGLAGLFETADDQFDRIRAERINYITEVRESKNDPNQFLNNEINVDTFNEYLKWKFPALELSFPGMLTNTYLFYIDKEKYKKLSDLEHAIERAKSALEKVNSTMNHKTTLYLHTAGFQLIIALMLVDKNIRNSFPLVDKDLKNAVEKNALS